MATASVVSPRDALNFILSEHDSCTVQFPDDICFGSVSVGGFTACAMTKCALLYASQHPKISKQTDVRSSAVNFFRPVFPARGPVKMFVREVSIGKAWSTLRVELFQGNNSKMCTTADVTVTIFSIPGVSLSTNWRLLPPPQPVRIEKLETNGNSDWTCWHPAFHPENTQRPLAYAQYFLPVARSSELNYVEHWLIPGWDCTRSGSRQTSLPEARWTNELLEFVADLGLPVQQNFWPQKSGQPLHLGSVELAVQSGLIQHKARDTGKHNWRESSTDDGAKTFNEPYIHSTLSMFMEIKKKLPPAGVRLLYVRGSIKSIRDGRMDLEILILDESMDLVAVSNQIAQIVPVGSKSQSKASL